VFTLMVSHVRLLTQVDLVRARSVLIAPGAARLVLSMISISARNALADNYSAVQKSWQCQFFALSAIYVLLSIEVAGLMQKNERS
jgi:hypothetical protein